MAPGAVAHRPNYRLLEGWEHSGDEGEELGSEFSLCFCYQEWLWSRMQMQSEEICVLLGHPWQDPDGIEGFEYLRVVNGDGRV